MLPNAGKMPASRSPKVVYKDQGLAPEREREALLPVFKQIARSLTKVTGKL
ncbi:MAG: hypothetical protein RLZZ522_51 [Verrucomicrobiota bacterium]